MRVIKTNFKDLYIIKQIKHEDSRGNLRETFRKNIIKWNNLIFDYVTTSKKNILRGFHFQYRFQQAKFINVIKGKKLTNMRTQSTDAAVQIEPKIDFSLEESMEFIQVDEYLEVTPSSLRMRKIGYGENKRGY